MSNKSKKLMIPRKLRKVGFKLENIEISKNIQELNKQLPTYLLFKCKQDILCDSKITLKTGQTYMGPPNIYGHLVQHVSGSVKLNGSLQDYYKPLDPIKIKSYKHILVIRGGGIGDLIFSYPVLKYIKSVNPTCKITYSCFSQNCSILNCFADSVIDDIQPLPINVDLLTQTDAHIFFEGVIERCKEAEQLDAYQLFFKKIFGNKPLDFELYKPRFKFNSSIYDDLRFKIPTNLVLLQIESSSPYRSLSPTLLLQLIYHLIQENYQVGIIDSPAKADSIDVLIQSKYPNLAHRIINLARISKSLEHAIEIARLAKGVIAVDSSISHIAAALGTPLVALYTCFSGNLRMSNYPEVKIIDSCYQGCGKNPCFYHTNGLSSCVDVEINKRPPGCISGFDVQNIINNLKEVL